MQISFLYVCLLIIGLSIVWPFFPFVYKIRVYAQLSSLFTLVYFYFVGSQQFLFQFFVAFPNYSLHKKHFIRSRIFCKKTILHKTNQNFCFYFYLFHFLFNFTQYLPICEVVIAKGLKTDYLTLWVLIKIVMSFIENEINVTKWAWSLFVLSDLYIAY